MSLLPQTFNSQNFLRQAAINKTRSHNNSLIEKNNDNSSLAVIQKHPNRQSVTNFTLPQKNVVQLDLNKEYASSPTNPHEELTHMQRQVSETRSVNSLKSLTDERYFRKLSKSRFQTH